MNLNYFKKIFAVSLMGFLFVFNSIPVSFAQTSIDCSKLDSSSCTAPNTNCEWHITPEPGICVAKGTIGENIAPSPSGPTTYKSNGDCASVGTAISGKNALCDKTVIPCPSGTVCTYTVTDCPVGSGTGWRCVMASIPQNVMPQDANLSATIKPYELKVTIPCNPNALGINGQCPTPDNPAGYIARLYQFGLMIVGFVALGAVIYGAALYTLSAGNMASKEEGKTWMLNAIYGILLLLGAYLILYTINPNLVNLKNPGLEPIDLDSFLPPATQVTDCSQITPDYSNISQPCGPNCKLDATTKNGCSTSGSNNSVSETSGSGSPGCLVYGTTGGMFSLNTTNNGQQVSSLSSSNSSEMVCTKCADGNDLVNGACVCKTNLVRQPDGTCNASNLVLTPCPTGYAHDTNTTCNNCESGYRKDSAGKCVVPTPVVPPKYCASGYTGPDGNCLP
ncbi:MAG: hypothetical protein M1155_00225 [Patescibacteria group bacterium]|nr:hypothetical protein [Patescibacteria group bacterium]